MLLAAPPALITIELHPIVRLSLSRKFHLSHCCDGGRLPVDLAVGTCALQGSLFADQVVAHGVGN